MQPQIQAIKQLLEANNATASQIEKILVQSLGDRASWENASLIQFDDLSDAGELSSLEKLLFSVVWRSRVDLNDARINAEEVDLDSFLTHIALGNSFNLVEANITLQKEIEERDKELNHSNKLVQDLRLQTELLKSQIKGLEAALETANEKANKAIALNLDAFQEAVNAATNPLLIEKLAEHDRELERVNGPYKLLEAGHRIERNFAKTVRDKLDLDEWNSDDDVFEAIANLKNKADAQSNETYLKSFSTDDTPFGAVIANAAAVRQLKAVADNLGIEQGFSADKIIEAIATLRNRHDEFVQSIKDSLKGYRFFEEADILGTITGLTQGYISMVDDLKKANEQNCQIQELQISVKRHHEQFEDLKSYFALTLKAINMSLNGLKGDRKPDEVKEVNGVMMRFQNYNDNLTHHKKTLIIGNLQRAIAEEARKLKALKLEDFSFDDIPF